MTVQILYICLLLHFSPTKFDSAQQLGISSANSSEDCSENNYYGSK